MSISSMRSDRFYRATRHAGFDEHLNSLINHGSMETCQVFLLLQSLITDFRLSIKKIPFQVTTHGTR